MKILWMTVLIMAGSQALAATQSGVLCTGKSSENKTEIVVMGFTPKQGMSDILVLTKTENQPIYKRLFATLKTGIGTIEAGCTSQEQGVLTIKYLDKPDANLSWLLTIKKEMSRSAYDETYLGVCGYLAESRLPEWIAGNTTLP